MIRATNGLVFWRIPSTKKTDRLKNTDPLPNGAVVYLASGPRRFNGADWWQVQSDNTPERGPTFGWVAESDAVGAAALVAFSPACPSALEPVDTGAIRTLRTLVSLACFGNGKLELRGSVHCSSAAIDSMVGGPSWLGVNWLCDIDGILGLHGAAIGAVLQGAPPNAVAGRYSVRGHFDDPEAKTCSWIPFGVTVSSPVGPPDPGAVIICRQLFVVTSVTKID